MAKSKVVSLFSAMNPFEELNAKVQNVLRVAAVPAKTYGHLHECRVPLYSQGQHCPNCSRRAWYIQRTQAECGNCGEVLPLPRGGN